VETDAPFLTPEPFRGRPNSPYLIPHTLRAMAAHLGTDVSIFAALINSNTEAVYGLWDSEPVTEPPSPLTAVLDDTSALAGAQKDQDTK
jgi:TatD DNase family protein